MIKLRSPTPDQLDDAPELAIVAALQATLEASESALFAANRELECDDRHLDERDLQPPRVWIACAILESIAQLSHLLSRYRRAIDLAAQQRLAQFDDLPF